MTRVQLRLRGAAEQAFNETVNGLNADKKEVVLDALALLHFAVEEARDGRKIGSLDPRTREFRAIALASLNAAAQRREAPAAPAAEEAEPVPAGAAARAGVRG